VKTGCWVYTFLNGFGLYLSYLCLLLPIISTTTKKWQTKKREGLFILFKENYFLLYITHD
jgi:hypothetical protein